MGCTALVWSVQCEWLDSGVSNDVVLVKETRVVETEAARLPQLAHSTCCLSKTSTNPKTRLSSRLIVLIIKGQMHILVVIALLTDWYISKKLSRRFQILLIFRLKICRELVVNVIPNFGGRLFTADRSLTHHHVFLRSLGHPAATERRQGC